MIALMSTEKPSFLFTKGPDGSIVLNLLSSWRLKRYKTLLGNRRTFMLFLTGDSLFFCIDVICFDFGEIFSGRPDIGSMVMSIIGFCL